MKAIWNKTIIAESDKTKVVEGNYYFPPESVNHEFLKNCKQVAYICPWKGEADYYDVVVDDRVASGAAWVYPKPKEAAKEISGYFAFWHGVTVEE